jgi:hypothetical protein
MSSRPVEGNIWIRSERSQRIDDKDQKKWQIANEGFGKTQIDSHCE